MFAFVALVAVALTTWLTLGAVFSAQEQLFQSAERTESPRWNSEQFEAGREAFKRVTRVAFFAALLSFFLASGVAGLVTRRLTKPLRALTDGARRLAEGERGIELNVPQSKDELQTLTLSFNNLVEGLEQQEAFRRNMMADIAHDLRTPLAVMRSELEGMQDGVVSVNDAALERLHSEVMLLSRLVDNLRTLSLAESGGLSFQFTEVSVKGLLQRLVDGFSAKAQEANVEINLQLKEDFKVVVDPEHLLRVLSNLLDNALRYASPGEVSIHAEALKDAALISVRDRGPGLDKAVLEQVFERFYRGDKSRTSRKEGSGLGLTIAKAIAEAHGGDLTAENHPEGGARFDLYLPLNSDS